MVSIGKSRTIGCTSAEYERPVSLRSRRSWIPARKSCWSRIMGERDVRPIWSSTSASIEASVPSTISSSTGSTSFTSRPPSSRQIVDPHGPSWPRPLLPPDNQGPDAVDGDDDARRQRQGGSVLLDHGRAAHLVAGTEVAPPHHRRVVPGPAEPHLPRAGRHHTRAGGHRRDLGCVERADAGQTHVHPLDAVVGLVAVGVAVEALVLVVEAAEHLGGQPSVDRTGRHVYPDLERLTVVAQVGGAHEPLRSGVEPLDGEGARRLALELRVHGRKRRPVELVVPHYEGAHVVDPDVHREEAEGAQVAGVGRHHRRREAEHVEEPAGLERAGSAEGAQRQVAHVDPSADGHLADGVGLVPRPDLEDPLGARLRGEPELARQGVDTRVCGRGVERDLACEQVWRGGPAPESGGGGGWVGAPPPPADGARLRAPRGGPRGRQPRGGGGGRPPGGPGGGAPTAGGGGAGGGGGGGGCPRRWTS